MKLVAAVILATVAPALAQPAETRREEKSPITAFSLSLGGTLGSLGLMAAGAAFERPELIGIGTISAFVAPSFGHFYAGDAATVGLAIRAGGGLLAGAGLVVALRSWNDPESDGQGGVHLTLAAFGLCAAGAIYDIVTAPRAANRWNEKHRITVTPVVATGTTSGVGFAVGGSF